MKNKKGFTLIELLAVIVILAIIALIAVPQILKILNKARLNAAKDSTYGIVKAAETYATNFMLENDGSLPKEDLVFNCSSYGCLLENNLENYNTTNLDKLSFKGAKPTSGKITISNNGKTIKAENLIINDFRCNYDKEVSCGDVDASEIPTPPTVLVTPTATPSPSGYSQSKTVIVNYTGDGTYLVMPTVNVTTNIEAVTCRDVEDASFTCDGEIINTNGTLIANRWYKVESNPTLTIEENGSIYYKVTDGTNYKDGGSLTITEIDRTAPSVASVTQKSATTNSITVTASGTDSESNIVRYQFSIDNGGWLPSEPQTSNEYTFTNVSSGEHQIKSRVINGTYINNGQNDLNTKESHTIIMSSGELTTPTAELSPSGWSQSKTATITFTGSGVYLIRPSVNVTTNIEAITCRDVEDSSFTCDGEIINTNGTLQANTWYKVESSPTLTIEENGSIYYKVTDGTNYKDGGSLTITEIDRTAPTVASVTQKSATTNSITVTASGIDNESSIVRYQFSIDNGEWLPSTPQASNEYTFTGLINGNHNIKVRVINGTFVNNGQNDLNTTESSIVPLAPEELLMPNIELNTNDWSTLKFATLSYTGGYTNQYKVVDGDAYVKYKSYDANSLAITGNFNKNGNKIIFNDATVNQYGPYDSMEQGTYIIIIDGENLQNISYNSYYNFGATGVSQTLLFRNSNQIIYSINLPETTETIEFTSFGGPAVINSITSYKKISNGSWITTSNNSETILFKSNGTISAKITDSINSKENTKQITNIADDYIKTGLVTYYDGYTRPTNGVWKDLSGYGNDGQLYNFDSSNGWSNNGVSFNGTNYISAVNNNPLYTGVGSAPNMTVELLFRKTADGYATVLGFDAHINVHNYMDMWTTPLGDSRGYEVIYNAVNYSSSFTRYSLGWNLYPLGTIIKITYSKEGNNVKTYVNGILADSQFLDNVLGFQDNLLKLGADYNNIYNFVGDIYLVRIYNRALTENEIQKNNAMDHARYSY